jgi:radical SAM superfamily enzyme YgiQ (UPF0313 family)
MIQPGYGRGATFHSYFEPLGLAYVASAVQEAGHDVTLVDLIPSPESNDVLLARLDPTPPEVVGISTYMQNLSEAVRLARLFKERYGSRIVFGGVFPTTFPEMLKEHEVIDFIVLGEGEQTFCELLKTLERPERGALRDVKGIAYRDKAGIAVTPRRERINDLDSLSFPMREGLPIDKYYKIGFRHPLLRKQVFLSMLTSRGCPFNCYFCSSDIMWNRQVTRRSVGSTMEELIYLREAYGVTNLYFYDEDFLTHRQSALEICEALIRKATDLKWLAMSKVSLIDEEISDSLARAGCEIFVLGIESVDEGTSRKIGKKTDLQFVRSRVMLLQRKGIIPSVNFMIGFPWDSRASVLRSYRQAKRIPLLFFGYVFATPFPATAMWDDAIKENLLEEQDPSRFSLGEPVMRTRYLSRGELKNLHRRILWGHFLSITYILNNLRMIRRDPRYLIMMIKDTIIMLRGPSFRRRTRA